MNLEEYEKHIQGILFRKYEPKPFFMSQEWYGDKTLNPEIIMKYDEDF